MEALDAPNEVVATPAVPNRDQEQREHEEYLRRRSLDTAIEHHKTNGGMLTVAQLIDNAKQFHAYITGETK